jgi:hypothetical protein
MMRQQMPAGLPDGLERPAGQHEHGLRRVPLGAAAAVGIACVQLLFVFSLGYPPLHAAPHEIPVGIAGPPPAVAQVEGQLSGQGDAYGLHRYADQAAARAGIENRQVYGAIVVTPSGPRLLMLNIGIPGAGALLPVPLLAQPWRAISPYLPPGAAVNAMRGVGFFHGAATGAPLLLLATWAAAGLVLVTLPTTGRAART